jgi:O-antigen ligase
LLAVLLSWLVVEFRSRRLLLATVVAGLALLGLLVLAEATGAVLDLDALLSATSRTGDTSEILTLTGRTELWEFAWWKIQQSPLVGYGFNAFEVTMSQEWFGAEDAGVGAHNSLLQALFTVGFIGTAPIVAAFAVLIHRWFARPNPMRDLAVIYVLISG